MTILPRCRPATRWAKALRTARSQLVENPVDDRRDAVLGDKAEKTIELCAANGMRGLEVVKCTLAGSRRGRAPIPS